jgi:hypothetical protein
MIEVSCYETWGAPMARSRRKGDEHKALLANLLASKTAVRREWLGQRLGMGHPGSVSRMLGEVKRNKKLWKRFNELKSL